MMFTDPLPPEIVDRTHNSFHVSWSPAKFCGIVPPHSIDSVSYTLEIAEGVEWKQNFATKYMNDMTASSYRKVCSGTNVFSARISDLKPAHWYHLRLVVDYLGLCVMSETRSVNTLCCSPSVPGNPNIYVIPVPSTFDLNSDTPARLDVLICWSPSVSHGHPISKYQVQLRRVDLHGNYVQSEETQRRKLQRSSILNNDVLLNSLTKGNRNANQWVKSPGKSVVQIQNSLSSRSKSAHSKRLPSTSSLATNNSVELQQGSPTLSGFPAFSEAESGGAVKWTVIYENLNRTVKLPGPARNETEWHVRVRAKNSLGWSAYTETLRVGSYTHPTLFRGVPTFELVPPSSPKANARLSRSVDFSAQKSMTAGRTSNLLLGVTEEEFMRSSAMDQAASDRFRHSRPESHGPVSSQIRFDSAGNNVRAHSEDAADLSPFAPLYSNAEAGTPQFQPFSPAGKSGHGNNAFTREKLLLSHEADHSSPGMDEDDLNPHLR